MISETTQANRLLTLETPLGEDVLLLSSFGAREGISRLFELDLDLLADVQKKKHLQVSADKLIGKCMTVELALPGGKARYFHGIVSRFASGARDQRHAHFTAELVPWAWLLTQKSNLRTFQDKTVPEIVKQVFDDLKKDFGDLVNYRDETQSGNYTKLDYCVQYRETDFNFVSRLLEQEGIRYFFEHQQDKHTLVLADSPDANQPCPNQPKARYEPEAGIGEWEDCVTEWRTEQQLRPGKTAYRDYHFQIPQNNLEVKADTRFAVGGNDKLKFFDYPGEYAQRFNKPDQRLDQVKDEGQKLIELRMQEEDAGHVTFSGSSYCRAFSPGFRFELTDDPAGGHAKYLLTSVRHSATQTPDYVSGEQLHEPYSNSFTCIPSSVAFRPPRSTPKPVVQGLQSAVVVGLPDEEIDCDKYGRVRVQFHWDREGQKDEKSSCWIRVASMWAGKQWGMIHIPRIDQEVVVSFLEGDPDHPLIVGSVYNYDQMPPYELPQHKTQSGVKSRSSKDGNDQNFNEIRFEDQRGKEHLYVHAERNFVRVVESCDILKVGGPEIFIDAAKGFQAVAIQDSQQVAVGVKSESGDNPTNGSQTFFVWNNQEFYVGDAECSDGSQTFQIWNNQNIVIGSGEGQNADGSQNVTIWKNRAVELKTGNDDLQIKQGNQTVKLDLGKSELEAMQSIEFKVGQNSIKIDQSGISIKGMIVKLEGAMMTDIKGAMTKVNGDGMLMVKGGVAMVN